MIQIQNSASLIEAPGAKVRRDHPETSRAAAVAALPRSGTQRRRVYDLLVSQSATDEEIQQALGMNPSTQRPRRVELVEAGFVRDSGRRRRSSAGRDAIVWEVVR